MKKTVSAPPITNEQFRAMAVEKLGPFLESKGFHRAPELESITPTGSEVVYLGKNVGFSFSLDVRDQCVSAYVERVRDGQLHGHCQGGYSNSIWEYLVTHKGYRGGPSGLRKPEAGGSALEDMINGDLNLLKDVGQSLLNDQPDSLPDKPDRYF